jgi:hypothetical protein
LKNHRYDWLDTVNFWQQWNSPDAFPEFPSDTRLFPHISHHTDMFPSVLITVESLNTVLLSSYEHARTQILQQQSFLARPRATEPNPPAQIYFLEPMFNINTATLSDMELVLNKITLEFLGM